MNNTKAMVNFEIPEDYYGDVEFPVRETGRRIGRQIGKAARKNKFPVGLRREINVARRHDRRWENKSKNSAKADSDKKILKMILEEMAEPMLEAAE